jgi:dienelactone hydrolase
MPPNLGPPPAIKAKVLVLHGWADPYAPEADVLSLARELTEAQADWQLHAYGGVVHAFTAVGANAPERGIVYDEAAHRRSTAATSGFLKELFGS